MKVTLFGPLPPPHGGVSVHVERLIEALEARGVDVKHEDEQGPGESFSRLLRRVFQTAGKGILHSHVHNPWTLWALGMRATFGRPTVVTVHNPRLGEWMEKLPGWKRLLVGSRLHSIDAYIAVSDHVREVLLTLGVPEGRIVVEPAFLPPSKTAWAEASVPSALEAFLSKHSPVIAMNAFHLESLDGTPLYGADMGPELLASVKETFPNAGLVLYVAREPNVELRNGLMAPVKALGVTDSFHMVTGSEPFGPLLVRSDVVVRPTVTDGDSVSVREALAVGVPVVASDVCARPTGVRVFPGRDAKGLKAQVLAALESGTIEVTGQDSHDSPGVILDVYHRTLENM